MVSTTAGVLAGALTKAVIVGVYAISSRSDMGRRDTYGRVVWVHPDRDIDSNDHENINSLLAFEWTHAVPQNFLLNDVTS